MNGNGITPGLTTLVKRWFADLFHHQTIHSETIVELSSELPLVGSVKHSVGVRAVDDKIEMHFSSLEGWASCDPIEARNIAQALLVAADSLENYYQQKVTKQ